jgi:hypothetical protein
MFHVTMDTRRMHKFLDNHSKEQIPYATSQAINKMLFIGKKGTERDMDRIYDGGATRWSKQSIRYAKSTKRLLFGFLYVADDKERAYIMKTIEGGQVIPKKEVLIQPMNISTNRYGNIANQAVSKRYKDPKFFAGKPYRGNAPNSARKNIKSPANDPKVGLWERIGRKGKRGGIARQNLIMRVQFKSGRLQRAFFPATKMAKTRFQKQWRKVFAQELVKAKMQAIQRGR